MSDDLKGAVEDSELLRARLELQQFEGHYKAALPWPSGRELRTKERARARETRRWTKDTRSDAELRQILKELCRLVLRQADTIAYLQTDVGFMIFLKTTMKPQLQGEQEVAKQWSIVKSLHHTALEWHKKKEASPGELKATLRTTLFYCVVTALLNRICELEHNEADLLRLEQLGIMEKGQFLYVQWNQETKKHERSNREHLDLAVVKKELETVKNCLIYPRVILRFHAIHKLSSDMTSGVVPFTLEIHNRCQESQMAYQAIERLSYNSVWHLVGGTARPAKLGRGPLEKAIEEMARKL